MADRPRDAFRDKFPQAAEFTDAGNASISKRIDDEEKKQAQSPPFGRRKKVTLTLTLVVANMLNYMDRNSVSAVLDDVKDYFHVNDTHAGLVRTMFVLMLTISVVLFGYLGDRFNRLVLLTVGLSVWAAVVIAVIFLPQSCFPLFVVCRMLVGVGEGAVSTVAPAMISDMFKGRTRSLLFAGFSLMIPVGAGFGYVVYSLLAKVFGKWQTGFHVSPLFSLISILVIWTMVRTDPSRGKAEGASISHLSKNSLRSDLKHIFTQKTFLLLSVGHTLQLFVVGSVLFWTPDYIERSPKFAEDGWSKGDGAIYFGISTMGGGLAGVAIGGAISSFLKSRSSSMVSDAYICAGSNLFSAPLFFIGLVFSSIEIHFFFVMVFLIVTCISTNWSVLMDASTYTIHPRCRSLALGIQLLITKIGGEAWSAYLIGFISDRCQADFNHKGYSNYYCLNSAMFLNCFMMVIGGFVSACASWFIDDDKKFIADLVKQESSRKSAVDEYFMQVNDPGVDLTGDGLPRRRINSVASPHHCAVQLPVDLPIDQSFDSFVVDSPEATLDGTLDGLAAATQSGAVSVEDPDSGVGSAATSADKVCPVVEFAAKRVQTY